MSLNISNEMKMSYGNPHIVLQEIQEMIKSDKNWSVGQGNFDVMITGGLLKVNMYKENTVSEPDESQSDSKTVYNPDLVDKPRTRKKPKVEV